MARSMELGVNKENLVKILKGLVGALNGVRLVTALLEINALTHLVTPLKTNLGMLSRVSSNNSPPEPARKRKAEVKANEAQLLLRIRKEDDLKLGNLEIGLSLEVVMVLVLLLEVLQVVVAARAAKAKALDPRLLKVNLKEEQAPLLLVKRIALPAFAG